LNSNCHSASHRNISVSATEFDTFVREVPVVNLYYLVVEHGTKQEIAEAAENAQCSMLNAQ
jgi:hypothetical protein